MVVRVILSFGHFLRYSDDYGCRFAFLDDFEDLYLESVVKVVVIIGVLVVYLDRF